MRSIRLSPALKSVLCPSRIFTSPSRTATRRHYSTESSKRDKEAVGVSILLHSFDRPMTLIHRFFPQKPPLSSLSPGLVCSGILIMKRKNSQRNEVCVILPTLTSNKLPAEKARQNATYGRPDVGGPFELVDQNGKPFTDKDLLGSYSLVYFGFTNCPDICPDELDKMGLAVEAVGMCQP